MRRYRGGAARERERERESERGGGGGKSEIDEDDVGGRKVCGSFAAKICGSKDFTGRKGKRVRARARERERERGGRETTGRYDLIKGSLLSSRDFPSRPVNEPNFSSDFRLLRGIRPDSIL